MLVQEVYDPIQFEGRKRSNCSLHRSMSKRPMINWGIEPMGFIFKRIIECRPCFLVSLSFKIDVENETERTS